MSGTIKTRLGIALSIIAFSLGALGLLGLPALNRFPYRLSHAQDVTFKTTYFLTAAFSFAGLLCGVAGLWLLHSLKNDSKPSNAIRHGGWPGVLVALVGIGALCLDIGNWGVHSAPSARNLCLNNLRNLEKAKEEWALSNASTNGQEVIWGDISAGFSNKFPACPDGGEYKLGRAGEPVTCSNPKHQIRLERMK